MGFGAAAKSVFYAFAGMFKSNHVWQYQACNEQRSCAVCGRHEELTVDIMSSDWHMIERGDDAQHAVKPGASASDVLAGIGVYAARRGKPAALRQ
jgi:hypothetical protein